MNLWKFLISNDKCKNVVTILQTEIREWSLTMSQQLDLQIPKHFLPNSQLRQFINVDYV